MTRGLVLHHQKGQRRPTKNQVLCLLGSFVDNLRSKTGSTQEPCKRRSCYPDKRLAMLRFTPRPTY